MSIKTILTAAILVGSSTAALASPMARDHRVEQRPVERGHGRVERPIVREQRFERPIVREQRVERPIVREHRWERPIVREERWERPIVRERDHRWERQERWERPIVRERYYGNNYFVRPYVYAHPIYLEAPVYTTPFVPFMNGALTIALGGVTGNAIELSSNGGAAFVQEVLITYSDGRTQLVQVSQELDASNPRIDLGTDGSPVDSVTIYGNGAQLSAYAI